MVPPDSFPWHIFHKTAFAWWRHQMEIFFALLAICAGNSSVPGEFPTQRPVMRSFDAYFDLRPNKRLSKQSWGWWLEPPSRPLWRHRNNLYNEIFMESTKHKRSRQYKHTSISQSRFCVKYNTIVVSTEPHGASNQRLFDCFFNSIFWLTSRQLQLMPYWKFVWRNGQLYELCAHGMTSLFATDYDLTNCKDERLNDLSKLSHTRLHQNAINHTMGSMCS